MIRDEVNNLCNNETSWTTEEVIKILNTFQKLRMVKITNFENLTISLRHKVDREVEADLSWMQEWTELWKGLKSDGYYLVNPNKDNVKRMRDFLKEAPFSKEVIMEATKKYLAEKEAVHYQFAKKSNKFIHDEQGSTLYGYCLAVQNGEMLKADKVSAI